MAPTLHPGDGSLRVEGELVLATVSRLRERLLEQLGNTRQWTLDLSGVTRADSAAVALLLELQREAHRRQCTLQVTSPPPSILAIARLSNLASLLPIADD